jgi:hypothetical protein
VPAKVGTAVFDPDTTKIMCHAFDQAWASLQDCGDDNTAPDREPFARKMLATRILQRANAGERNPDLLCYDALAALARAAATRR